jgi:hypothetical protein
MVGTERTDGEGTDGHEEDAGVEEASGQEQVDHAAEAEKWKALSRKHEAQAKKNAAAAKRLSEMEEASKTDFERLQGAAEAATKRAAEAESRALKYEVALSKKVPQNLMKFLVGETEEELEASAEELMEAIGGQSGTGVASGKPKEKMRGGASPEDAEEEKSVNDVLAAIPRAT